jgi:hypothetical protein
VDKSQNYRTASRSILDTRRVPYYSQRNTPRFFLWTVPVQVDSLVFTIIPLKYVLEPPHVMRWPWVKQCQARTNSFGRALSCRKKTTAPCHSIGFECHANNRSNPPWSSAAPVWKKRSAMLDSRRKIVQYIVLGLWVKKWKPIT